MSVIGKITCVEFNWYVDECNEALCDSHTVGVDAVIGIREVDPGSYVVDFENGSQEMIYNPNRAYWTPVH